MSCNHDGDDVIVASEEASSVRHAVSLSLCLSKAPPSTIQSIQFVYLILCCVTLLVSAAKPWQNIAGHYEYYNTWVSNDIIYCSGSTNCTTTHLGIAAP